MSYLVANLEDKFSPDEAHILTDKRYPTGNSMVISRSYLVCHIPNQMQRVKLMLYAKENNLSLVLCKLNVTLVTQRSDCHLLVVSENVSGFGIAVNSLP